MKSETAACIGKTEIRELIPHSGSMCLLDEVKEWNQQSIICTSHTHLDRTNPLRRDEHLSAIHAFEYGAQAAAIHGGLCARSAGSVAPPGYLAALRDASVQTAELDQLVSPLEVRAHQLFGDTANCVYQCRVSAGDLSVAQGRITIILRPSTPSTDVEPEEDRSAVPSLPVPVHFVSTTSREIQCSIPLGHPSLPGHFCGNPIVPGVVILDEVAASLADWRGCRVTRIHLAKFVRPLLPEQNFKILLTASSAVQVDFQCHVNGRPIVAGRFEVSDRV
jgi:predicted hotdog family 3-hydroxylacyl-ACP dehydratase